MALVYLFIYFHVSRDTDVTCKYCTVMRNIASFRLAVQLKFNLLSEIMDNTCGECRHTLNQNTQVHNALRQNASRAILAIAELSGCNWRTRNNSVM